jgi:hypothetical protein
MEPEFTIFLMIVLLSVLIGLAIMLAVYLAVGAAITFSWAVSSGLMGFLMIGAAWTFLLPFMLIACVLIGYFSLREEKRLEVEALRKSGSPKWRDVPPDDPFERKKWANREPPYDH